LRCRIDAAVRQLCAQQIRFLKQKSSETAILMVFSQES